MMKIINEWHTYLNTLNNITRFLTHLNCLNQIIFIYKPLQILLTFINLIIFTLTIMASYKLGMLLVVLISISYCQFSNFIPAYALSLVPKEFIAPVPLTEPLDSYVSFGKTPSISSFFGVNEASKISSSILGSVCKFPFVLLDSFCQCPKRAKYIFGKCLGITADDYINPISDPNPIPDPNPEPEVPIGQCPLLKINNRNRNEGIQDLAFVSRTFDGTNNNLLQPDWGAKDSLLERRVQANYEDKISKPISFLPGPRDVSNTIGSQQNPIRKNRLNVTIAFTIFGQFVDHDVDLTPSGSSQKFDINIPRNDKFFGNQRTISFSRSRFIDEDGQPRRHPNVITSWIDGSQIYGSDNQTACALRTFKNGKLKTSRDSNGEDLLPKLNGFFRAGDIRAIQNSVLTSYHTIFMRQHNRLCDKIIQKNPKFNDETIFQIARNYVIGLLQKIVIKDFAKILLGDKYDRIIGRYNGYKSHINPNIPTEFSTASYRIGHTLLPNVIPTMDKNKRVLKNFSLNQLFFRQDVIDEAFIGNIMRGASQSLTKQKSPQLVDDVRNLLVLDPTNRQVKLDLFSLNIQRGRDHGLPFYNDAREAFGLPRIKNFADLLADVDLPSANQLKAVYGSTDAIQLFIGIISEKPVNGGILGDLGAEVVGQTFRNLRDGDRLWYQNVYPKTIINLIDRTELGDIIRRNVQNCGDLPSNIFIKQR